MLLPDSIHPTKYGRDKEEMHDQLKWRAPSQMGGLEMGNRVVRRVGVWALLAGAASACGSEDTKCLGSSACSAQELSPGSKIPLSERIEALAGDISLGSIGQEVLTVHEYLTRFGYFPSDDLLGEYPGWRPVVRVPPALPDVFDEHSTAAVRELQRRSGLEPTGVVDELTRALLRKKRCGVPDQGPSRDPAQKFALQSTTWLPKRAISWYVRNTTSADIDPPPPPNCTTATCRNNFIRTQVENAVRASLTTWSNETGLTFNPGTEFFDNDVEIKFADLSGDPIQVLARSGGPKGSPTVITMDNTEGWSTPPSNPTGDRVDLQTVLTHEIGHSLGLDHSSFADAVMASGGPPLRRALNIDDRIAISSRYDEWDQEPGGGLARDIGAGGDGVDSGSAPDVWVLGRNILSGSDYEIYRWSGSGWQFNNASRGATRISVAPDDGKPWIISQGSAYQRSSSTFPNTTNPEWIQRGPATPCLTDIAAGPNNTAWKIDCVSAGPGGFRIFRWDVNNGSWLQQPGAAVRIAVARNGVAWCLDSGNAVYRFLAENWQLVGEGLPRGTDIAAGPNNTIPGMEYVFVLGQSAGDVYVWNEQAGNPANEFEPQVDQFQLFGSGRGVNIAVASDGRPWLTASNLTIWRSKK